ncbi:colicin immunity domain-containing protein [Serratia plymuthica]|uniref:colicin immunity domain-containing protein n=1 Tax=Serratia plymuthica TaxID=82996 RepID=UPI001E2A9250|nr:colicin immunity domain-containing protein [Serratia plymuthica]CAI1679276.1 Microcin-D immunity protein [Serratia plymuthica]
MSRMKLVELGKSFIDKKISAEKFAEDIVIERRKLYGIEEPNKSIDKCGGELFILADCYNPEPDRDDYELDEAGLRKEVKAILEKFNLL